MSDRDSQGNKSPVSTGETNYNAEKAPAHLVAWEFVLSITSPLFCCGVHPRVPRKHWRRFGRAAQKTEHDRPQLHGGLTGDTTRRGTFCARPRDLGTAGSTERVRPQVGVSSDPGEDAGGTLTTMHPIPCACCPA